MFSKSFVAVDGHLDEKISIWDRGFLYGDALIATMLSLHNRVLYFEEHWQRLEESGKAMGLDLGSKDAVLKEGLKLLNLLKSPKACWRLMFTSGDGWGLRRNSVLARRVSHVLPLTQQSHEVWLHSKSGFPRFPWKHPCYGINSGELRTLKPEEDILWHYDGRILESSTANIVFFSKIDSSRYLITSPGGLGIFPGLTRSLFLKNLKEKSLHRVEEREVFLEEISNFEGAFLLSSLKGLISVKGIDEKTFLEKSSHFLPWDPTKCFKQKGTPSPLFTDG